MTIRYRALPLALALALAPAVLAQGIRPIPLRAGDRAPVAGQLYPAPDAARLIDLLRDRQSYRAEADARSREASARTSEAAALRDLVEVEKARSAAYRDVATRADRAARGQKRRNWLSGLKGIFLGLTLGRIF